MGRTELTKRIYDRLYRQIAPGGLTQRKTTKGEIILECSIQPGIRDLSPLASDLALIVVDYIAEATTAQIKSIIKEMLQ